MSSEEISKKVLKNHMGEEKLLWVDKYAGGEYTSCSLSIVWMDGVDYVVEETDEDAYPTLVVVESYGTNDARNDYINRLTESDPEWKDSWIDQLIMESQMSWYEAPHQTLKEFYEKWDES